MTAEDFELLFRQWEATGKHTYWQLRSVRGFFDFVMRNFPPPKGERVPGGYIVVKGPLEYEFIPDEIPAKNETPTSDRIEKRLFCPQVP